MVPDLREPPAFLDPSVRWLAAALLPRLADLKEAAMATQADVDALTRRISDGVTNIRADIQAIKEANPDLDLSALERSVDGLDTLAAENPEPPPGL